MAPPANARGMRARVLALALAAALLLTAGAATARHGLLAHPWSYLVDDPEVVCVAQEGVVCFGGPLGIAGAAYVDRHLQLQEGLGCRASTEPSAACGAVLARAAVRGPWPGAPACAALGALGAGEPMATAVRLAEWFPCFIFSASVDAPAAAACVLDGERWQCTTITCMLDTPTSGCSNDFLFWGFARR